MIVIVIIINKTPISTNKSIYENIVTNPEIQLKSIFTSKVGIKLIIKLIIQFK